MKSLSQFINEVKIQNNTNCPLPNKTKDAIKTSSTTGKYNWICEEVLADYKTKGLVPMDAVGICASYGICKKSSENVLVCNYNFIKNDLSSAGEIVGWTSYKSSNYDNTLTDVRNYAYETLEYFAANPECLKEFFEYAQEAFKERAKLLKTYRDVKGPSEIKSQQGAVIGFNTLNTFEHKNKALYKSVHKYIMGK